MTKNEQRLYNVIAEACALIKIEANDHASNYIADKDRRKSIANTLNLFCEHARAVALEIEDTK